MADDTQPDIIGTTATWTKPDMGDAEFGLAGYKMFQKDILLLYTVHGVQPVRVE